MGKYGAWSDVCQTSHKERSQRVSSGKTVVIYSIEHGE